MDASQLAALSDSDLFGNVANSGWARSESEDERENRVESAVDAMSDLFDWLVDG